jgi:hypothetical protein
MTHHQPLIAVTRPTSKMCARGFALPDGPHRDGRRLAGRHRNHRGAPPRSLLGDGLRLARTRRGSIPCRITPPTSRYTGPLPPVDGECEPGPQF